MLAALTSMPRDGENSILVAPGDVTGVTSGILRLIDEPNFYSRLAQCGIKTAERFSHVEEASRHLELYAQWVSEKRLARRGRTT